ASSSPYLSLTAPLNGRALSSIRRALEVALARNPSAVPNDSNDTTTAAVLIPLCNVDNKPGVLMEVRGKLRQHSGEVSFPGGRVDNTDKSYLDAALRETKEELGIPHDRVEILGELGPATRSLSGMRVLPYVGFVHKDALNDSLHSRAFQSSDQETPFPSMLLSSLIPSAPEVAQVFHLPLEELVSPTRLRNHEFRGGTPYWAVNVSDLVGVTWTEEVADEIGGGRDGRLEVWGLTGWYVGLLMEALGLY
ncbi:hypothetical protein BD410DRAFT_692735, partial [Rickenella mellea]